MSESHQPAPNPRTRTPAFRILGILTFLYTAGLLAFLAALEWWGERNWLFSLALFAPPQLFLAPLAVLTPACLLFRPRLYPWHLLCVVAVVFGYMTNHWWPRPMPSSDTLALVTHNVGQGNLEQFASFLDREKPDAVLLQDAKNRAPNYIKRFPGYEIASRGEFVLFSRHLIQQSALIEQPKYRGRPVAARFEIIFQGKPLVLYNVHLPTPRAQFNRFLSPRIVGELFGDDEHPGGFTGYRTWIDERIELARALAKVLESERQPFIVAGDFNMPDHGVIYHTFADQMTDAFATSGHGWGLTFPGETRNPVAFFGPWLRLDYLFAGRGWAPISCDVEPGRKAQHRAVVARFNPLPAGL